jgi:histidine triad (HIT) family protein
MSENCIFCKIVRGEIPSRKIYEDEDVLAFHDICPAAPVHFLIIPKRHIESLAAVSVSDQAVLGKMMIKAAELAKAQGLDDGFRTIINTGQVGCQEVYHLHMHVLGGRNPLGPILAR